MVANPWLKRFKDTKEMISRCKMGLYQGENVGYWKNLSPEVEWDCDDFDIGEDETITFSGVMMKESGNHVPYFTQSFVKQITLSYGDILKVDLSQIILPDYKNKSIVDFL